MAKPQTGAGGELQARARKVETGGAAVMMYEGSGEVEAAGARVEVERGMGTAVPEAGPPAPPEKLLPAPETRAPAAGDRLPYPDPELAWSAVAGAASYTLELCRDAGCQQAYLRRTGLTATTWRPAPLAVAEHHWRVTAVSVSGLDGYPSPASVFTVLTDERDREPPTAVFELEGPAVDRGGETYYGPATTVRIAVADEPAGVASWRPLIDGREGSEEDLSRAWSDGEHAVDAAAIDRLGNEGTREGPRFTVDAEPPRVIWEVGGDRALAQLLPSVDRPDRWQRRWRSWQKRARRTLARRGADPALWALVAWNTDAFSEVGADWSAKTLRWRERRRHQTVSHAGGSPALLIVAPRLVIPGSETPVGEEMVLVRVEDEKSGARALSLRTAGSELEIETIDRLGNRRVERARFLPP